MTPVVAVVGWSGAGKTTLITQLINNLTARGYRVGALKHTHHNFEIDHPGKDSFAMKAAGAVKVGLVSPHKLAFFSDLSSEPSLEELITRYFEDVDLVLAEGFKDADIPKILVERSDSGELQLSHVIAIVSLRQAVSTAHFRPDEAEQLADFLEARFFK